MSQKVDAKDTVVLAGDNAKFSRRYFSQQIDIRHNLNDNLPTIHNAEHVIIVPSHQVEHVINVRRPEDVMNVPDNKQLPQV